MSNNTTVVHCSSSSSLDLATNSYLISSLAINLRVFNSTLTVFRSIFVLLAMTMSTMVVYCSLLKGLPLPSVKDHVLVLKQKNKITHYFLQ